jgi:hypothetical protein
LLKISGSPLGTTYSGVPPSNPTLIGYWMYLVSR